MNKGRMPRTIFFLLYDKAQQEKLRVLVEQIKEIGITVVFSEGNVDKETLSITDSGQAGRELQKKGCPVLGYLHEENRDQNWENIPFLVEHLEEVTPDYLCKVWQRQKGFPWHILETQRCLVRETTEEDVDSFYQIYADSAITEYMEDLFPEREQELEYSRIYREKVYGFYGFGMWSVVEKESGAVIGRAGLTMREGYELPELGFVIGIKWQGQGIAEEVCRAILAYGVEELDFSQVLAFVHPANVSSIKLLEKLGFVFEKSRELGEYDRYCWNNQKK